MNPLLLVDSYKIHHTKMYPDGMTKLYSNFTPRKSRIPGIESVVTFGLQHFIKEYLIDKFNNEFFRTDFRQGDDDNILPELKKEIIDEYKHHCNVDTKHIEDLWDLGYLPIEIKALDEGTLCPIGVPMLTITNTHPDFAWLVNYLETLLSCQLWQPITSATLAYEYKKILSKYAIETTGSTEGVQWQAHDFSMRGMSSSETAILSGMGHLTSFTGTDTIPAIYELEKTYNAKGLIGASVPATEHSVMCMGTKESELDTFRRLMKLYPEGILSIVSDTWNLWDVCTKFLPQLKNEILARNGKIVIRPDSGDPVDIICGYNGGFVVENGKRYKATMDFVKPTNVEQPITGTKISDKELTIQEEKGVIELLWDIFGGTINEQGYKVLDPHIGAIYGDGITLERTVQICERLKAKGFASTNIVLGIGSYTYQCNTRDTFGFAMKATAGVIRHKLECDDCKNGECKGRCDEYELREIFKDPITDDGTKKSKKGLLAVHDGTKLAGVGKLYVDDQCTWEEESKGLLKTVFKDGKLVKETTLDEIRNKLK